MSKILGVDTSNYTTSVSLLDTDIMEVKQEKLLLPVKAGEKGIRQSDAVFHHTAQLPVLIEKLFDNAGNIQLNGLGVSFAPRLVENSYMPCFTVGDGFVKSLGAVLGIKPDRTSHQMGHILAGLYSCQKLDLLKSEKPFIAFDASGGTTDLLLCKPNAENILDIEEIGTSLDLKAGQAVDRVGVMLGFRFPCGKELDKLAGQSDKIFKVKPVIRDNNCSISGVENQSKKMFDEGQNYKDIARFCVEFLNKTFEKMIESAFNTYGRMPVVCVGGVMSNSIISKTLSDKFGAYFSKSEFSCDNAVGVAVFSAIKKGMI